MTKDIKLDSSKSQVLDVLDSTERVFDEPRIEQRNRVSMSEKNKWLLQK